MDYKDYYHIWKSHFGSDHRFLRAPKWKYIMQVIDRFNVRSVLEFGPGLSTLLFESVDCNVDCFETDRRYAKKLGKLVTAKIRIWDNKNTRITKNYHMSLVDGAQPRGRQLIYATKHSNIIIRDDIRFGRIFKIPGFVRIDDGKLQLGIFVRKVER